MEGKNLIAKIKEILHEGNRFSQQLNCCENVERADQSDERIPLDEEWFE